MPNPSDIWMFLSISLLFLSTFEEALLQKASKFARIIIAFRSLSEAVGIGCEPLSLEKIHLSHSNCKHK